MNKHFNLLQVSFPPLATCLLQTFWEGTYFLNHQWVWAFFSTGWWKFLPLLHSKQRMSGEPPYFFLLPKKTINGEFPWEICAQWPEPVRVQVYMVTMWNLILRWIFLPPLFLLPSKVEANKAQILTIFTFFPAHRCSSQEQSLMAIFITLVKTHNFKTIGEELSGEYMSGMG